MNLALLHYSVAPVVGGVEAVIQAHTRLMLAAGYSVTLVAGAGEGSALPPRAEFVQLPEMDSQHPSIVQASRSLEAGQLPGDFPILTSSLEDSLAPVLQGMDLVIVHNIFTKHFNLPLTAALTNLLDKKTIHRCIAWCHDFTWTSPHSRPSVHPGYPWDLLRTSLPDVTYVTVSRSRQQELAGLLGCPPEQIKVIYNGVDPAEIYSLSGEGQSLVDRLDLDCADLVLLMPVRITQAKNIEYALQMIATLKTRGLLPRLVVTGPPDPHDPENMSYYYSLLDLRRQLGLEQEARFVYESGPQSGDGYTIGLPVVRQLYRLCDALLMPSHREGFGMPVLEAGLIGMPVFTTAIPAAEEIGEAEVVLISADDPPELTAQRISDWAESSTEHQLRVRIRRRFTWQAIFQQDILPMLRGAHGN
jgi:glycosyltransferase involved in cell wall biosynthesis